MKCHIINPTSELAECRSVWTADERFNCRCLEDVLYTQKAEVPLFQRLSIYVPRPYMNDFGEVLPEGRCGRYTAANAPVIFANNAAGYMQMPHTWLGGPRCSAEKFLREGMVYVTCGCRGRESRKEDGGPAGKAPATLIDFKTAIRFLRHNSASLPGDWSRIVSTGWSAGGAMSALLGITGDHPDYAPYLHENGAFMEESDSVYAAQIYCPIIDLAHADLAYEWCFAADPECEDSPAGPAETMTPFKAALSEKLKERYVAYLNEQDLRDPETGEMLRLDEGGRSGSFYHYILRRLEKAAEQYLLRLPEGDTERYISGQIPVMRPVPCKPDAPKELHHAGQELSLQASKRPMGLGEQLLRENFTASGTGSPEMTQVPGTDKRNWLSWDGKHAHITSLDDYVLNHRRRMKPCTSFDTLPCDSGENQLFGNAQQDYVHFDSAIPSAAAELKEQFPREAQEVLQSFSGRPDADVKKMLDLIDPMNYISDERGKKASFFRIRVGASDADTSFSISAALSLSLQAADVGKVDDAMVWDQPHCQADYPGELEKWIHSVMKEGNSGCRSV